MRQQPGAMYLNCPNHPHDFYFKHFHAFVVTTGFRYYEWLFRAKSMYRFIYGTTIEKQDTSKTDEIYEAATWIYRSMGEARGFLEEIKP